MRPRRSRQGGVRSSAGAGICLGSRFALWASATHSISGRPVSSTLYFASARRKAFSLRCRH